MTKTIKQKVMDKVLAAPKARVGRRTMYVLPHKAILKLSKSPDSATRRLREMVRAYGSDAIEHKDGNINIEPKFVNWLRKQ